MRQLSGYVVDGFSFIHSVRHRESVSPTTQRVNGASPFRKISLTQYFISQTNPEFGSMMTKNEKTDEGLPLTTENSLLVFLQGFLWESLSSAIVLILGYIFLAIPVGKVIIHERDDQLAKGIAAACNEIAINQCNNDDGNHDNTRAKGRVVAVLGLLHVNGVTKRLLEGTC